MNGVNDANQEAWVHTLKHEAQDIISIELRPIHGEFPSFEAGAHIDLQLPNGLIRSYSLLNDSRERYRFVLGVLKDRKSRGGSLAVHEQLRVGMRLRVSAPRNHFPLHENAAHSILIAGGIGVTPILCMGRRLKALGRSFELMYFARSKAHAAFAAEIEELGMPTTWHFDDEQGGPPDLKALLARRKPNEQTHHYACGPGVMLDAFEAHCQLLGHPNAHIERFAAAQVAAAADAKRQFTVELRQSGLTFEVTADTDLHQCLLKYNANVPFSCEEGICGSCETRVLEGEVDHRDSVLSTDERMQNKVMMVCVSGCKSERLVLDL